MVPHNSRETGYVPFAELVRVECSSPSTENTNCRLTQLPRDSLLRELRVRDEPMAATHLPVGIDPPKTGRPAPA